MQVSERLAVVVVHYGDTTPTLRTLASIRGLLPQPKSVYVVDNSGNLRKQLIEDGAVEVLGEHPNLGYAGAINLGARVARDSGHEFVWILNNDVSVMPNAQQWWDRAILDYPTADIVGSYVVNQDGRCWFGGGIFDYKRGVPGHLSFGASMAELETGRIVRTDWINGCSMLIPLRAFEVRGEFDEWLYLYKEELEWQIREPKAEAYLVQEPLVRHWVGLSTGSAEGRLGKAFMARNGLILANRQAGLRRWAWRAAWAREFLVVPTARRQRAAVCAALVGARGRHTEPGAFMESLWQT